MGKKEIDIDSIDLDNLTIDELLELRNKLNNIIQIYTDEGKGFTEEDVLKKLVVPLGPLLEKIDAKNGMKRFNILLLVEEKTNSITRAWKNKEIYDLDTPNRPYVFEMLGFDEETFLSIRGIGQAFLKKFIDFLEEYGYTLETDFTQDDYKKLFLYAKQGGAYRLSLSDVKKKL